MTQQGGSGRSTSPWAYAAMGAGAVILVALLIVGGIMIGRSSGSSDQRSTPSVPATSAESSSVPASPPIAVPSPSPTEQSPSLSPSPTPNGATRVVIQFAGSAKCPGGAVTVWNTLKKPMVDLKSKQSPSGSASFTLPSTSTRGLAISAICPTWPFINAEPVVALQYQGTKPGQQASLIDRQPSATDGNWCWAGSSDPSATITVNGYIHDGGDPMNSVVTLWANPMMETVPYSGGEQWHAAPNGSMGHQDAPYC